MARISESELILPSLLIMANSTKGQATTSLLIEELENTLQLSDEDRKILANRNDTRFSQIVRNLKSHQTFEKNGYADYKDGTYTITENGKDFLNQNKSVLVDLFKSGFPLEEKGDALKALPTKKLKDGEEIINLTEAEDLTISEGQKTKREIEVVKRSSKLRVAAMEHYTKHGRITCEACCFDFETTYGDLGKGFIEIHHKKFITTYMHNDFDKSLADALQNVSPLCANCHRIIHRKSKQIMRVEDLKAALKVTLCN